MSGGEHRVAAAPGASSAPSPGSALVPLASLASLASGLLFAVGLAVAGMTNPAKVIAFLDVTGQRVAWDPALALVMAGAIAVYASAYWWSRRALSRPLFASTFSEPGATVIDRRLLLGSATFGIGWGLAGYCPGPALVSLATGSSHAIAFCLAMAAGFGLVRLRR